MRVMYDAIYAANLPPGGDLYAGYVDGEWPDANAISERFPDKLVVRIATNPATNDGDVYDCEKGNGTPEDAVNWTLIRRHAGKDPSVYCNTSTWPSVQAAFATHDVPQPYYWIADYSPSSVIPAGAVALQHTSTAAYDVSSVADYWPGVDPAPAPVPEEDEMSSTTSVNGRAGMSWPAGSRHVVQVTYDPAHGDPDLRVVLALVTGPWVAPNLAPAKGSGSGNYEIPQPMIAGCRGVVLEGAADGVVYDACAV